MGAPLCKVNKTVENSLAKLSTGGLARFAKVCNQWGMHNDWRARLRAWAAAERGRPSQLHYQTRLALATVVKFLAGRGPISQAVDTTMRGAYDELVASGAITDAPASESAA